MTYGLVMDAAYSTLGIRLDVVEVLGGHVQGTDHCMPRPGEGVNVPEPRSFAACCKP